MGVLVNRTERIFTDEEIARIAGTYHAWRGTASARGSRPGIRGRPRLLLLSHHWRKSASTSHVLTPGRYVGAAEVDDQDGEPIADKIDRLTKELFAHFDESARLEQFVRTQLERLDV